VRLRLPAQLEFAGHTPNEALEFSFTSEEGGEWLMAKRKPMPSGDGWIRSSQRKLVFSRPSGSSLPAEF